MKRTEMKKIFTNASFAEAVEIIRNLVLIEGDSLPLAKRKAYLQAGIPVVYEAHFQNLPEYLEIARKYKTRNKMAHRSGEGPKNEP